MRRTISLKTTLLIGVGLLAIQALLLYLFGQPSICECGYVKLWEGTVASSGNSQHLSDWYTPSHLIHGILFYALLSWLFPRWSIYWRFLVALLLEVGWEVLENTPMVIDHYRKQALAQGYVGDSILNSLSDTLAMVLGFMAARKLPVWISILSIVALEAVTLYFIRDGLALNVINLLYPLEFIHNWQSGS